MTRFDSPASVGRRVLVGGLIAVFLAFAGCPREEPAPPPEQEPLAPPALEEPRPEPEPDPEDVAAVQQHQLSVDEVRRYGRAAEAVHEAVTTDPELRGLEAELQERMGDVGTISEAQQILEDYPRLRRAIEDAGISTENYLITGAALFGAYNYVLLREQGIPEPFLPDYVTDAHIRFVEQNRADVDAVVERLMQAYAEHEGP